MAASLNEAEVVRHLMFHKALLGDEDNSDKINHYLALARSAPEGEHVAIEDPFEKAIALAFELVLHEHMDPWKIDLVRFTTLYLERLRSVPEIDLITAGRLVLMAWTILKLQSDGVKERAEPPPAPEPPPEPDPWFGVEGIDPGDPSVMYDEAILERGEVPIDEKIRHKGDRKVTFMELLEALEAARGEAEMRMQLVASREADKATRAAIRTARAEGAAHKENQEEDIAEVWERIASLNGHPIPITDIQEKTREDVVKTLVSVLFLARSQKIKLWQENFPYGQIFVQNKAHEPATTELAATNTQN